MNEKNELYNRNLHINRLFRSKEVDIEEEKVDIRGEKVDIQEEKIKKIIDEYHYQPNTFAQSLKAKETKIIGIIAPTLTSITSSRVLMSLDAYLKEKLMQEMMTYLNQFKKGVIMVSHSRDEVYQMCSDTVIMHQGMIETLGKTKEIFDNPGTVSGYFRYVQNGKL